MIQKEFITRTTTLWLLATTLIVLLVWDWFAYKSEKRGDTISEVVLSEAKRYTSIPFFFGCVMGHFFWPQYIKHEI